MTDDIGMDRNPRAMPARAAAQVGVLVGIVMAIGAGVVLALALSSPDLVTLGQDVPVWPVAAGVVATGVLLAACSVSLGRRVRQRDRDRITAQGTAAGNT